MKVDRTRLLHVAPYLVPLVIVGLGWALLVRPTSAESARLSRELDTLRARVNVVGSDTGAPPPEPVSDPMTAFERQVSVGDASGRVLEGLSRLATSTGVRIDVIETADEGTASLGGGPVVAGGLNLDPRFALFPAALKYTPVTLTADSDYASLGHFLWRLRDLATVVEIRSLEIVPAAAEQGAETAPAPGTIRVTLTMFAFSRVKHGAGEAE